MITSDTLVYTNEGWKSCWDLYVGQPVRSYDESTNTCIDDVISAIETDYIAAGLMGIKSKSMNQLITQDHPIIIVDHKTCTAVRKPIGEYFYHVFQENRRLLHNRPYKYYMRTTNMDDVKWSARICATYAQVFYLCSDQNAITIAKNLSGYESWIWLDTFFHWNVMLSNTTRLASCDIRNRTVRDIIFDLASRAGYGARFVRLMNGVSIKKKGAWIMQLDLPNDIILRRNCGWYLERYEGNAFNITTKNGSFLAKRRYGTFLMGCNKE